MRKLVAAVLVAGAFSSPAFAASCNDGNRLDDYLYEWLNSGADTLAKEKQLFSNWDGNEAGLDALVNDYKAYFGQRAAPIAEIGYCGMAQLGERLNYAFSRFQ